LIPEAIRLIDGRQQLKIIQWNGWLVNWNCGFRPKFFAMIVCRRNCLEVDHFVFFSKSFASRQIEVSRETLMLTYMYAYAYTLLAAQTWAKVSRARLFQFHANSFSVHVNRFFHVKKMPKISARSVAKGEEACWLFLTPELPLC
jgi:hypothetical protein